jgi:putative endonuclease
MMYTVYILYSKSLCKYYAGHTSMEMEERLSRHLCDHEGFTSNAKDWQIIHVEKYDSKTEAIKIEMKIKKRGIKRYLDSLQSG